MIHQMRIDQVNFDLIKSGKKIVETRLLDKKRQQISIWDTIEFSRRPDFKEKLTLRVIDLLVYPTIKSLVDAYPITLFGFSSDYKKEDYIEYVYSFYSKDDEEKYGVVGIKMELSYLVQ